MTTVSRGLTAVLVSLLCESVFTQTRSASPSPLDAINARFSELGIPRTMEGGFDPLNGDVYFRFMTKDRKVAFGLATTGNILQISIAGVEGEVTRVVSSARITMNADGSESTTLQATEAQLIELSRRFNADAGKLDTLVLRLQETGALAYEFTAESGSKSEAVIDP